MKKQKVTIAPTHDKENSFTISARDFEQYFVELLHELDNPQPYHTRKMMDDYREQLLENYYCYKFLSREFNWQPTEHIKSIEPFILMQVQKKGLQMKFTVGSWSDENQDQQKPNTELLQDTLYEWGKLLHPTEMENKLTPPF